jgi:hypothetical protein
VRTQPASRAWPANLWMPPASAVQAINFINFQIRTVPTDGINAANYESGDFGRVAVFGAALGQAAACQCLCIYGIDIKAQGCRRDLNSKLR